MLRYLYLVSSLLLLAGCTSKLEQENQSLKNVINDLQAEKSNLTVTNNVLIQIIDDWKSKLGKVEESNQFLKESNNTLITEKSEAAAKIRQLEDKIETLRSSYELRLEDLLAKSQKMETLLLAKSQQQAEEQLADLRNNFEVALKTIKEISMESLRIASHPEAAAASLSGRTIRSTRAYRDWEQRFTDTKIKVWEMTKVNIDREDARKIGGEIRSLYSESNEAGKTMIDSFDSIVRGKTTTGGANQVVNQIKVLDDKIADLKKRISELK